MRHILVSQDAILIERFSMQQNLAQYIIGFIIVLSSLGVILTKKPVHSCLWFLLTLLALASMYLQLNSPFISVMQVLVYAGAILVIFMFVIVLFQDAYLAISQYKPKSAPFWLFGTSLVFLAVLSLLGLRLASSDYARGQNAIEYGSVEALGKALYIDFFFPFEAVALLFLVAIVGSLYIGRKT